MPAEVPYYTTDDETQPCGHVWRERSTLESAWGYGWAVYAAFSEDRVSGGWSPTQAGAEAAMREALKRIADAKAAH